MGSRYRRVTSKLLTALKFEEFPGYRESTHTPGVMQVVFEPEEADDADNAVNAME
jgi:hypothetical protein